MVGAFPGRLVPAASEPETIESPKWVLTSGHGGYRVSVHQTRRGAIPEATGSKRRRVWVSARTCRRFAVPRGQPRGDRRAPRPDLQ